eukprot:scaffold16_cov242-Pinguiococcus_pyrenoidosus.AAC.15
MSQVAGVRSDHCNFARLQAHEEKAGACPAARSFRPRPQETYKEPSRSTFCQKGTRRERTEQDPNLDFEVATKCSPAAFFVVCRLQRIDPQKVHNAFPPAGDQDSTVLAQHHAVQALSAVLGRSGAAAQIESEEDVVHLRTGNGEDVTRQNQRGKGRGALPFAPSRTAVAAYAVM